MSAPKPWNRAQTSLNSSNSNEIITPSGNEISANPQGLAANAAQTASDPSLHKSPAPNNSTTPTTGTTATSGSTLATNRPGYSSYGGGYGMGGMGGMSSYGGMGRMGMGGMGGMGGMYGGGMGGMYGGGMYGNQGGFLQTMNEYVFSICQAAQMIEGNANGIGGFAMLIKKFFTWLIWGSKEWLVVFGKMLISNVRSIREWVKQKVHEFFYKKDLSSEEINKQVKALETVLRGLQISIGIFFVWYLFRALKKMVA